MSSPDFWIQTIGESERRLLSIRSCSPLSIHLASSYHLIDEEVKALMKAKDPSVLLVSRKDLPENLSIARLDIDPIHIETLVAMKYSPRSIPSVTKLVIHDFWSVSQTYPLLLEILDRPWRGIHIFARNLR